MSYCQFCEVDFEGSEEVIMIIRGTWGISPQSGRAILIEDPQPEPLYWHPVCYVQAQLDEPECELLLEELRNEVIEETVYG
tara:strand:- start:53 stop:295 length:243 start_codon:yes stop_codon:yes gene_type:complete